jgi:hypothetical protein
MPSTDGPMTMPATTKNATAMTIRRFEKEGMAA